MTSVICPFCGLATAVPHETQEGCIEALQAEVNRTRRVLENVTEPLPAPAIAQEDESQTA